MTVKVVGVIVRWLCTVSEVMDVSSCNVRVSVNR